MFQDEDDFEHDEALSSAVNFVPADFPHNVRRVRDDIMFKHVIFASADMKYMSKFGIEMIGPAMHSYVFSCALQSKLLPRVLSKICKVQEGTGLEGFDSDLI